ncbi:MAG: hypothetical protein ACR5LC_14550, partial [Symbiopectobacterium sp.]|uniref:hypothetical protein n=1 Tax=Symbiopectobacterium sp. TaxID=2952789 RepID=UPI003F411C0B
GGTGIGRGDYLDPYLYGSVDIASGATDVSNSNNALGGSVSFMPYRRITSSAAINTAILAIRPGMTPPIAVSTTGLPPLAVTTPCAAWWSTAAVTVMKPKITVMLPSTAIQLTGTPAPCWPLVSGGQPTCTS